MENNWSSAGGADNSVALRVLHPDVFVAISEIDRLGHLLLNRFGQNAAEREIDWLVGIALLRRAVTTFVGFRTLLEASCIDPAKALARSHLELWMHYRCLVHGAEQTISASSTLDANERKERAARYYVAAQRRALRARALILAKDAPYPPSEGSAREALRREFDEELIRLRTEFPAEWAFFGDVSINTVIKHVGGRDEPSWFSATFAPKKVRSIRDLSYAFGMQWEYDFIYDALSSQVHPRGLSADVTLADDHVEVHHPHNPDWFESIVFWASHWHMLTLMSAARSFVPVMEEDLRRFDRQHGQALRKLKADPAVLRLG